MLRKLFLLFLFIAGVPLQAELANAPLITDVYKSSLLTTNFVGIPIEGAPHISVEFVPEELPASMTPTKKLIITAADLAELTKLSKQSWTHTRNKKIQAIASCKNILNVLAKPETKVLLLQQPNGQPIIGIAVKHSISREAVVKKNMFGQVIHNKTYSIPTSTYTVWLNTSEIPTHIVELLKTILPHIPRSKIQGYINTSIKATMVITVWLATSIVIYSLHNKTRTPG